MGPPNGSSADDARGPEAAPTEASSAPAVGSDPAPLLDDFLHVIDEIPRPAGAVLVSVESTARASAFRVDLADVTPKCAVAEPIEAWFAELSWDFFSLGTGGQLGWGTLRYSEFRHPTNPVVITWSMDTHDDHYWLSLSVADERTGQLPPSMDCIDDPSEPPAELPVRAVDESFNREILAGLGLGEEWGTAMFVGSTQLTGNLGNTVAWQSSFTSVTGLAEPEARCAAARWLRGNLEDFGYEVAIAMDPWHEGFSVHAVGPVAVVFGELSSEGHWTVNVVRAVGSDGEVTYGPWDGPQDQPVDCDDGLTANRR